MSDVLATAVETYKNLLVDYAERCPDADDGELLEMLDAEIMEWLPNEADVATVPALFEQVLCEQVPPRRWLDLSKPYDLPTIGWMMPGSSPSTCAGAPMRSFAATW